MPACHASSTGTAAITTSRLALLGSLALLGACAGTPMPEPIDQPAALRALQATDLRVATVAYWLAVAGEPICPRKTRLTGVTLHNAGQYAPALRQAAREILKVSDRISVLAVVPGSPAAKAGVVAGDALLSIGGVVLALVPATTVASYDSVAAAEARLERMAQARALSLEIGRGDIEAGVGIVVELAPVAACVSQVQLRTSPEIEAKADGRYLSVTTAMLDYVRSDDELALVIAHEMAHNALGHRVALAERGVVPGNGGHSRREEAEVLAVERIADRFGYFLMARAGYDPGVAAGFWQRLHEGPARSRKAPGTHPSAADRVAHAVSTAAEIKIAQESGKLLTP